MGKLEVEKSVKESSRLKREDRLDAAFQAIVKGGFAEARVLTLAENLGVKRGSFYWHFADHAAMLDALVERWFEQQMQRVQFMAAHTSGSPMADLDELVDMQLTGVGSDLKATRFELVLLFYLTIVGCYQALGRPTNPPNFKQTLKRIKVAHLVERPWGDLKPSPLPIL